MDDPPFGVTNIYATSDAYTHMHVSGVNTAQHTLVSTLNESPLSYFNGQ